MDSRRAGSVLWKLLATIVILLLLAGAGGYTYERWGTTHDLDRLAMPGRLVSVGTHKLHIHCTGSGSPTILLESGWSMPSAIWARTQPLLARHTRTCVYDRAGYGWSDPGPLPRTASRNAAEAEALLDAANIQGPILLVGHSYGGIVARLLAQRIRERVAGVVLVDAVHEDMLSSLPLIKQRMEERRALMDLAPYLAELGLFRLAPAAFDLNRRGEEFAAFTDAEWDVIRTFRGIPRQINATLAELLFFEDAMGEARRAHGVGFAPLVVLSAGSPKRPRWVPPDYSDEDYFTRWTQLQEKLRKLSTPPAPRLIAEKAGHEIPVQQPEMVERAVLAILQPSAPQ